MYLVCLFHSRPPDKVQAVWCEQERCARLLIRNLFENLLYVANGIGVEWIREIDDLIVWIACSRLRSISDYESILTQTLGRALEFQPWNHLEGRDLYFVQIQHCLILTVPEPNQFCVVSEGGDKVERAGGVNLHRSFFFDMGWVGHVKDGEPSTMVLLDQKMHFAITCIVEQHRLARYSCEFRKILWVHEDNFIGMVPCFCLARECEGCYSREG